MVTKEQFINGLLSYADKEVIPQLPTTGKWGLGSIILLSKNKATDILSELSVNPFVNSLGIVNCDGLIDVELLSSALIQTANRYGKCDFNIPLIGCLSFSAKDIEMIKTYIIGGLIDE